MSNTTDIRFETCRADELFFGEFRLSQEYQCHGITTVGETNVRRIRVPRSERLSDCRQWELSHRSAFLFCNPDVTFTINLRRRGLLSTTRDIYTYVHVSLGTHMHRKGCCCQFETIYLFETHLDPFSKYNPFQIISLIKLQLEKY